MRCHSEAKELPLVSYSQVKANLGAIEKSGQRLLELWIAAGAPEFAQATATAPSTAGTEPSTSGPDLTSVAPLPALPGAVGCSDLTNTTFKKILHHLSFDGTGARKWQKIAKKVAQAEKDCLAVIPPEDTRRQCFSNMKNFVANQEMTTRDGHTMGFKLSNDDYLKTVPPAYMQLPEPLRNGLPENWPELCRAQGWSCATFVSKSLPNPSHNSFKRLIIMAPGKNPGEADKWMLFTLPKEGVAEQLIDYIAVEKTAAEKKQVTLFFAEYWRNKDGTNPKFRDNMASCYKCHPSGMKDLVPAYGSTTPDGKRVIDGLNQKMRDYGQQVWSAGSVDLDRYGPPMGKNQGCLECHNGRDRGFINAGHLGERSRHQIYFKMVQDLTMPPELQKNPQHQYLFSTLEKAQALDAETINDLYTGHNQWNATFSQANIYLGGDKGPMALSNQALLRALDRHGVISSSEKRKPTGFWKNSSSSQKVVTKA